MVKNNFNDKKQEIKICLVLGTRPEIIKMAPIVRECEKRNLKYFILHTGQHYSEKMDKIFFHDLNLRLPKYNLKIGGQPYGKQVGAMVKSIMIVLQEEKPDIVVVQGDTISVLAGALAASKLGIKLAHHEAGLRSHDPSMMEEVIRVIVDHTSDFLMVPTREAVRNLKQEGGGIGKIVLTGNTIVDAVLQNTEIAGKKTDIARKLNLQKGRYILVTCHRAENVDKKERLEQILEGLKLVYKEFKIPIIFPLHPRTRSKIAGFNLPFSENIFFIDPVGFLEFLQLEKNAKIILTDSGGIQEEAFILGIPCVTLRDSTERPETVKYKMNILAGTVSGRILECVKKMINKKHSGVPRKNPFGDGKAAEKIIQIIGHPL